MALSFPSIDPVMLSLGPIDIRWYGMSYVAGILLGWWYCLRLIKKYDTPFKTEDIDAYILWILGGVVIGGRLGMVLFYAPGYYFSSPEKIFMTWQGGMSFHGGVVGAVLATWLFARSRSLSFLRLSDLLVGVTPIGLFLGRIANFINQEMYGKVTDVPWGVMFPQGGYLPRHPTQLYEAIGEGVGLFLLMAWAWSRPDFRNQPGRIGGAFFAGYGIIRFAIEPFREVGDHLGAIVLGMTTGQWLSIPMILIGTYYVFFNGKGQANGCASASC